MPHPLGTLCCFCLCSVLLLVFVFVRKHFHGGTTPRLGRLSLRAVSAGLPTPYPLAFRIQFDTNITRQLTGADARVKDYKNSEPLRSTLYYDWKIQAQRVDHPAGSYECVYFYNVTKTGCHLYFLPSGMYRVINMDVEDDDTGVTANMKQERMPSDGPHKNMIAATHRSTEEVQSCCLDIPRLGAPPPDWAKRANPTFKGLVHDSYSGYDAYEFVFDNGGQSQSKQQQQQQQQQQQPTTAGGTNKQIYQPIVPLRGANSYDQYHTAREVHDGTLNSGAPLTFTFPSKAKGRQDFHFDPTSLVVGDQDPAIFQLPSGCENVLCHQETLESTSSQSR